MARNSWFVTVTQTELKLNGDMDRPRIVVDDADADERYLAHNRTLLLDIMCDLTIQPSIGVKEHSECLLMNRLTNNESRRLTRLMVLRRLAKFMDRMFPADLCLQSDWKQMVLAVPWNCSWG